jgi:hypothetical protein
MQIFLSHATKDADLVGRVARSIRNLGVKVFLAEEDDRAGANVHKRIAAEIRASEIIVVLLTTESTKSAYVQQEIGYAKRDGKLILPLVTSAAAQTDLAMLSGIEYILVESSQPDEALERVAKRVKGIQQKRADDLVFTGAVLAVLGLLLVGLSSQS